MFTKSEVLAGAQGALFTVQRKVFVPTERPVTSLVGSFTSAKTPVPLTTVHVPTAGKTDAVALRLVLLAGEQIDWSAPALAFGASSSNTKMETVSVVSPEQAPLLRVHTRTFSPTLNPVTVVVGLLALVKFPVPLCTLQTPVAGNTGALAPRVTLAVVEQMEASLPALATVTAPSFTVMVNWSLVMAGEHGPLLMVH